jgi:hypothetical protein
MLLENNVRAGLFERKQYLAMQKYLDRAAPLLHDVPTKNGDVGLWSGNAIAPSGFCRAWCCARIGAGCSGSIPHDFRRTATGTWSAQTSLSASRWN